MDEYVQKTLNQEKSKVSSLKKDKILNQGEIILSLTATSIIGLASIALTASIVSPIPLCAGTIVTCVLGKKSWNFIDQKHHLEKSIKIKNNFIESIENGNYENIKIEKEKLRIKEKMLRLVRESKQSNLLRICSLGFATVMLILATSLGIATLRGIVLGEKLVSAMMGLSTFAFIGLAAESLSEANEKKQKKEKILKDLQNLKEEETIRRANQNKKEQSCENKLSLNSTYSYKFISDNKSSSHTVEKNTVEKRCYTRCKKKH
jgi:hypothetical protein